ncbi:MAG: DUF1501 domain-containing protein [Pseudomonadota bacterium]
MTKRPFTVSRRMVLAGGAAMAATAVSTRPAFAAPSSGNKLAVIILRGALDGLAAVPPSIDQLADWRPNVMPENPLRLTSSFALHPALGGLHGLYTGGEASIVHAVASPYRGRSHFVGQDLLESGSTGDVLRDGWLNRALQSAPTPLSAVSIGPATPLVLRGPAEVGTWSPPVLPEASGDTLARLGDLYADDPMLGSALAQAVELDAAASDMTSMGRTARGDEAGAALPALARLMAAENGPDIGVASVGGWDSHAGQIGQLNNALSRLDAALLAMKDEFGAAWARTQVAVVTEFGRTVKENGTRGTDHGTGGAAFLLGGAVAGGQILGDWPGLAERDLFEGRDLAPANDLRAIFMAMLGQQFGFSRSELTRTVFPGANGVLPLTI